MAAAQQKTQAEPLAPQNGPAGGHALDVLEEAGGWYFDDDGGGLKNFALRLDAGTPAEIAQAFLALDLVSYDAATCRVAVWLFDRAMPLPPQKGRPAAPRKQHRKPQKKGKTRRLQQPPRVLWPGARRCAPSCL
jgi:hypothetical protein